MTIATGQATVLGSLKALAVTTAIGLPFIGAKLHKVPPQRPVLGKPGWQQGIFSSLHFWGAFLNARWSSLACSFGPASHPLSPTRIARVILAFSLLIPHPSSGSFPPTALPPAQTHTKVKRKEAPMTFLYLPASLSTSDVNEALHVLLLSKHRCFCFMGWWDGMELINQSASAVLPHSCNFKARSHRKRQKQNRQSLQRELRCFDCASCLLSHLVSCSLTLVHSSSPFSRSPISINLSPSPVPSRFLRNQFQSHLNISPTPIFLPSPSFCLRIPYPHPTLRSAQGLCVQV